MDLLAPAVYSPFQPGRARSAGLRRAVFSSSGDLNRASHSHPWNLTLHAAQSAAEGVFAALFPSECRLCRSLLTNISRVPVCRACLDSIGPISGDSCSICGEALASFSPGTTKSDALCGMCRRLPPPYKRAVAYGNYDGALRGLIHLLKYDQVRPAADKLGNLLAQAIESLPEDVRSQRLLVVPVPLYSGRKRARGFNQTELIARAALRNAARDWELAAGCLERRRDTASQTGLTRHQRRANVRGAFKVAEPSRLKGRAILVVDDVFTTGTTAAECARVLGRAGADTIYVATVARVRRGETGVEDRAEN